MKRKWWIAGAAALAVAVIGAGAVMAQSPTPGSGSGTTFLDRVAQKLGIETPKLQDAFKSAANDEVDQAVKDGKITQEQADAIKQRIAEGKGPGFGDFPPGKGGFGLGHGEGKLGARADVPELATFLGISQDQLRTELQADGATLATVAQTHDKSRDELKTFLSATTKAHLDQAVKDGKLTQQQEDTMLAKFNSSLDSLIDQSCGGMGHGHGNRMAPMAPGMPGPGTRFGAPPYGGTSTSALFRG